jgi:hypothetical protein
LTPVVSLGDQHLASNFSITQDFPPVERQIPLDLVRCDAQRDEKACGLVQLRHTFPSDLMYSSYGYRSGINESMAQHLGSIAKGLEKRLRLQTGDLVVDIGANDGTMLLQYESKGPLFIGFEPSNIQPENPTPHIRFLRDYFSASALRKNGVGSKAKIITSIAMFYDLEDPNSFVRDVAEVLDDDGLWVLEMSYLPSMLDNNSFDTICHEHLEYYALHPLERLLEKHGLYISDVELNDANGGSLRVTACHRGSVHGQRSEGARSRIYGLKKREFESRLDTEAPYKQFVSRIEKIRTDLPALISKLRADGKRVYGYGASTKGNVILQYCGINGSHIEAIADRNAQKWGTKTVGTNIAIISEEDMRKAKPDYLLVLPWHFMKGFVKREEQFVGRGGKFIVPIPDVRIVP